VYSRTEATLYAIEHGIVDTPGNQVVQDGSNVFKKVPISSQRRWIYFSIIVLIILTTSSVTWYSLQSKKDLTPIPLPSSATPTSLPRWQEHAALPEGRAGMAAAVYENQIYLFAGEMKSGVTNTALRYDIETDQWHSIANKPTSVTDIQAVMIGEKFYIPGGWTGNSVIQNMEVYDPRSDAWEERAPLPQQRSGYAMTIYEGRIYLFGGWDGVKVTDTIYTYNSANDTWSEINPMPIARAYMGVTTSGPKIFLIGGWNGVNILSRNDVYIPSREGSEEQNWYQYAPLPRPLCNCALTELASVIYLIGKSGHNCNVIDNEDSSNLDSIEYVYQYYPQLDQWYLLESPRYGIEYKSTFIAFNNYLFNMGGQAGSNYLTNNQAFQALYIAEIPFLALP